MESAVERRLSSPRAHMTRFVPSAASSSATARPSPLLLAATNATFPRIPRSILSSQVIVFLVEPVLSRRAEDVDVECLFERFCVVRHIRRNMKDLASCYRYFLLAIFADPELQRAFEDVGDLLVVVRMLRDDAAFLQIDVRQHHPFAGDESSLQHVGDPFLAHGFPP